MNLSEVKNQLPNIGDKNVIVVLSGGMDSSTVAMLLTEHYGNTKVSAVSFNYGQKQVAELSKATELCEVLGIKHKILDLSILGEISKPFSANISGSEISTPTYEEVVDKQQPTTYVPNRNMIMYSLVAAIAEVENAEYIFCGLQVHDAYGYYDTSQEWVDNLNKTLALNPNIQIKVIAPFSQLSKFQEIELVKEMGKVELFKHTLTCYNPNELGESCGVCPSCVERLNAFKEANIKDPIFYIE